MKLWWFRQRPRPQPLMRRRSSSKRSTAAIRNLTGPAGAPRAGRFRMWTRAKATNAMANAGAALRAVAVVTVAVPWT